MRVFMCYSHKDMPFVDRLVKDLREAGISVWRDVDKIPGTVGANTAGWRDAVDRALNECTHMVVVLSADSVASSEVSSEWNYFLANNKPALPALAGDCKIPYRLLSLEYYDFRHGYDPAFQRLYGALTGVPSYTPTREIPAAELLRMSNVPAAAHAARPSIGAPRVERRRRSARPLVVIAALGLGALFIAGCAILALALLWNPAPPGVEISFLNNTGVAICYLYISPTGGQGWGADWLYGSRIEADAALKFEDVPGGTYDLKAEDCYHNVVDWAYSAPFDGDYIITLENHPDRLIVENLRSTALCAVYVQSNEESPEAGAAAGHPQVDSSNPIPALSTRTIGVPDGGVWDIHVEPCDGSEPFEEFYANLSGVNAYTVYDE